jgi:hypothetical protein
MSTATISSGARIWRKRVASGTITHPQAVQFCHAIYPLSRGEYARGKAVNIERFEAEDIVAEMFTVKPMVDEASAQRGRQWLAATVRQFGLPQWNYFEIVEFRFTCVHRHPGVYDDYFGPEYTATWPDGRRLTYAPTAWQRGLNREQAASGLWFITEEA